MQSQDAVVQALALYEQGVKPNASLTIAALKACASSRDIHSGRCIHRGMMHTLGCAEGYIGNTLVDMYAACSSLDEARYVFDGMARRSIVSWNCIIKGYAENGEASTALELFAAIDIAPGAVTFLAVLGACSRLQDVNKGRAIHARAAKCGLHLDSAVANAAIDMYRACSCISEARRVFDCVPSPSLVSWNCIMSGYADCGDACSVLQLFALLISEGGAPDRITILAAAKAMASASREQAGVERAIHSQAVAAGCEMEQYVASSLVDMYAKRGRIGDAHRFFSTIPRPGVVAWTSLILGYAQSRDPDAALELVARMQQEGTPPNGFTFVAALHACSLLRSARLNTGRAIHEQATAGGYVSSSAHVASALVNMYAKCGSMADAREVFDAMPRRSNVACGALLLGYAENGEGPAALNLFARIQGEEGVQSRVALVAALRACLLVDCRLEKARAVHSIAPGTIGEMDAVLASSLVDVYAKCGRLEDASRVFGSVPECARDQVLWNCMIMGHAECGESTTALRLYRVMLLLGEPKPDVATFLAALKACSNLADLVSGRSLHAHIVDAGVERHPMIAASLIDLYGRCGRMEAAMSIFDALEPSSKGVVAWCSLMAGYARIGDTSAVLGLFQRMLRECAELPNDAVFLVLLTACSHAGMLAEAKEYFRLMKAEYGLVPTPEHHACMVDLLGRANRLEEAVDMAIGIQQSDGVTASAVWSTILGAASKWGDNHTAALAFQSLQKLGRADAGTYVLVSNAKR